jgi:hypothetical protein
MLSYCYKCARRGTVGSCRARRENPVRGVAHRPPGKPHSRACSLQAQLTLTLATHVTGSSCDSHYIAVAGITTVTGVARARVRVVD